jgi:hypothetical protein
MVSRLRSAGTTSVVLRCSRSGGYGAPRRDAVFAAGRWNLCLQARLSGNTVEEATMDGIIYLVGLIVIILAILSFFGLR